MQELHLPATIENAFYPCDTIPHDLASLLGESLVEQLNNFTISGEGVKTYTTLKSNTQKSKQDVNDSLSSTNENNNVSPSLPELGDFLREVLFSDDIDQGSLSPTLSQLEESLYLAENKFSPNVPYVETIMPSNLDDGTLITNDPCNFSLDCVDRKIYPEIFMGAIEAPVYSQQTPKRRRKRKIKIKTTPQKKNADIQQNVPGKKKAVVENGNCKNNDENSDTDVNNDSDSETKMSEQVPTNVKSEATESKQTTERDHHLEEYCLKHLEMLWEKPLSKNQSNESVISDTATSFAQEDVDNIINTIDPFNDNIESRMFLTSSTAIKSTANVSIDGQCVIPNKNGALPNAFDLWTEKYRKLIEDEYPDAKSTFINQKLTEIWCKIPDAHRKRYFDRAKELITISHTGRSGQFRYLHRFKTRRHPKSNSSPIQMKKRQNEMISENQVDQTDLYLDNQTSDLYKCLDDCERKNKSIHKPIVQRPVYDDIHDTEKQSADELPFTEDNHDKYDYLKALKETTTYNSPQNKEMKKMLGKYKIHEEEILDFTDENSLATGFLMDVMITSDHDTVTGDEMTVHRTCSPLDVEMLNSLDISSLDNYLTGKERCELLDDIELQEQMAMQKDMIQKNRRNEANRRRRANRKSDRKKLVKKKKTED